MSKPRAGLPEGFDLGVTEEEVTAPVEVPDYLDREFAPPAPKVERPASPSTKVLDIKRPTRKQPKVRAEPEEPKREIEERPRAKQPLRRRPRKELSLDAETERKAAEVVTDIQEQGPQADATASEFVKAIVQLAYDARHKTDYSRLNLRGQWGSPTAKAFIADLKEAFLKGIGKLYLDRYSYEAKEQLTELSSEEGETR